MKLRSSHTVQSIAAILAAGVLAVGLSACSVAVDSPQGSPNKSEHTRDSESPETSDGDDSNSGEGGEGGAGAGAGAGSGAGDSDSGAKKVVCTDKTVTVNTANTTVALTGECGTVMVNAANVKLTADSIEKLVINGADSTFTVGKLSSISLIGAGNTITWSTGDPSVSNLGADNVISQG